MYREYVKLYVRGVLIFTKIYSLFWILPGTVLKLFVYIQLLFSIAEVFSI